MPLRTFYANNEHTYILAITKKHDADDEQRRPVFTYLVSNIGERLRSVKREEIEEDDLPEMEGLFRVFVAAGDKAKNLLENETGRCKLVDIDKFRDESHWVVDRWWTKQEKIDAGAEESTDVADRGQIEEASEAFDRAIAAYDQFISAHPLPDSPSKEVSLGDRSVFKTFIGKRVLVKNISQDDTKIPLYSANAIEPMGFVENSRITDFGHPAILWGIDNSLFNYRLIPAGQRFATTDHCGTVQIIGASVVAEYVLCELSRLRDEMSFDRSFRSSLTNMRQLVIKIPTKSSGEFDVEAQKAIAERFTALQENQRTLQEAKARLDDIFSRYLVGGNWH